MHGRVPGTLVAARLRGAHGGGCRGTRAQRLRDVVIRRRGLGRVRARCASVGAREHLLLGGCLTAAAARGPLPLGERSAAPGARPQLVRLDTIQACRGAAVGKFRVLFLRQGVEVRENDRDEEEECGQHPCEQLDGILHAKEVRGARQGALAVPGGHGAGCPAQGARRHRGAVAGDLEEEVAGRHGHRGGGLQGHREKPEKYPLAALARPDLVVLDHVGQHAHGDKVGHRQAGARQEGAEIHGAGAPLADEAEAPAGNAEDRCPEEVDPALADSGPNLVPQRDGGPGGAHHERDELLVQGVVLQDVLAVHDHVRLDHGDSSWAAQVDPDDAAERPVFEHGPHLLYDGHRGLGLLQRLEFFPDPGKGHPRGQPKNQREDGTADSVALSLIAHTAHNGLVNDGTDQAHQVADHEPVGRDLRALVVVAGELRHQGAYLHRGAGDADAHEHVEGEEVGELLVVRGGDRQTAPEAEVRHRQERRREEQPRPPPAPTRARAVREEADEWIVEGVKSPPDDLKQSDVACVQAADLEQVLVQVEPCDDDVDALHGLPDAKHDLRAQRYPRFRY
mmetsp:Transcript_98198/g.278242  ORF Transcript_98198/g.278242 Transcript_98198/m.278242 type:complete len:565 (-) Transcript_98198:110-1804(-)|eukprot:CAMPEP_0179221952 /NCGR_PEP_ID=MMETSP0797-20121207/6464_1 /TAXON_ID=47934 /ORGANISM="Dinophysis acuminata, Strain DAEP01" /LENGTH=564 /DNA_ID=CAMNT_0020928767 /DNA_START=271 /DNA_END=1965 /DNA_ORIENTATION=-